jgi:hypothetical protein
MHAKLLHQNRQLLFLQFKFDGILHNATQEDVFEVRAAAATATVTQRIVTNEHHPQCASPSAVVAVVCLALPRQMGSCCMKHHAHGSAAGRSAMCLQRI